MVEEEEINMEVALNIITALGTIVAAISIICAFVLYRVQKRDEYLTKVRESLQILSNDINEMDAILNFELAYEMASNLIYTDPVRYSIESLMKICNEAIQDKNHDKSEVIKKIENRLNIFGTSFTGPLVTKYTNLASEVKQASTVFYPDFKGLFRFAISSVSLMQNILMNYKKILLKEELIAKVIYENMVEDSTIWISAEQFKKELLDHLIFIAEISRKEHHQNDIDQLGTLVDLVYSRHIELSTREWNSLAKDSKKARLIPNKECKTITANLREAEKYFQAIFTNEDIVTYSSLVQKIEDSNN